MQIQEEHNEQTHTTWEFKFAEPFLMWKAF